MKRGARITIALAVLVLASSVAYAQPAGGQPDAGGILNSIVNSFRDASSGWASSMLGFAWGLFGLLAMISFAFNTITYAMRGEPQFHGWLSHVVRECLRIGFWAFVLSIGTEIMPIIVASLSKAGQAAGGIAAFTPSDIVMTGLDIAAKMDQGATDAYNNSVGLMTSVKAGFNQLIVAFCALIVFGTFCMIAAQVALALVEMYLVTGAGVIFLGFGGSPWTSDFSQKVLVYAISVGTKLMVLSLLIGVGQKIAGQWVNYDYSDFSTGIVIIGVSLIYLTIVWKVPDLVVGMLQGVSSSHAGHAGAAASMIGGAVGGAAGAATAVASGAAGGAMALGAAGKLAATQQAASAGAGNGSSIARNLGLAGRMASNLAGAAAQDLAGGVSRRQGGSMGGRMAEQLSAKTDGLKAQIAKKEESSSRDSNSGGSSPSGMAPIAAAAASVESAPSATITGAGNPSSETTSASTAESMATAYSASGVAPTEASEIGPPAPPRPPAGSYAAADAPSASTSVSTPNQSTVQGAPRQTSTIAGAQAGGFSERLGNAFTEISGTAKSASSAGLSMQPPSPVPAPSSLPADRLRGPSSPDTSNT